MQTITINDDSLLQKASQCVGISDLNEVIDMALHEFIRNHQVAPKRRQPPASILGKSYILGDLVEPCVANEDFECLK
jgi:hypothetical protein